MFVCVDDTDGKTAEVGLTFSAGELQISKNGGAFANAAGTATELSDGAYYYEATETELNTNGPIGFKIEKTGVRTTIMNPGMVVGFDPSVDIASAANLATLVTYVDTEVAAILAAVDTEIAAIQADTDNIQTRLPAALVGGRMDASVGAMASNTLTADALATDAVTEIVAGVWNALLATYNAASSFGEKINSLVAAPTAAAIAAEVWATVLEGAYTATHYMRLIASSTVWKVSGFSTNAPRFRNAADTKDRISGTTTADGRTAVSVDAT